MKFKRNKPATVKEALQAQLGQDVCSDMEGLSRDDLRLKLSTLAIHEEEIRVAMADDVGLQEAKTLLKDLRGPYTDSLKDNTARRRFAAILLEEAGG